MINLAKLLFREDEMKTIIAFLAAMAMASSGFAADEKPVEKKKEPAKAAKAAPAPTATPGVVKIEKKEHSATEEKKPKPKVKRPEELAAEKAAKETK
jgi:hypothetical protein